MALLPSDIYSEFVNIVNENGKNLRFRYYDETVNGSSYDNGTLAQSGTDLYASGILQTTLNGFGTQAMRQEQGFIKEETPVLYCNGSVSLSGLWTVNASGTNDVYAAVPDGIYSYTHNGIIVYQQANVRWLPTGSLTGW